MLMFRFYFSVLITFLFVSCNSNDNDTDPVVEVMEEEQNNVPNTGRIRTTNDGFELVYEYDEQEKVISGFGQNSERRLSLTYTYDQESRLTARGEKGFMQPGHGYEFLKTFKYDSNEKIVAFGNLHNEEAVVTYEGDQAIASFGNGQVIVVVNLDSHGRVWRIETPNFYRILSYDENGNLVSDEEYNIDSGDLITTYLYSYDSNTNPFFRHIKSAYLADFIFKFWISNTTLKNSYNYEFAYLPNNLLTITKNNNLIKTFDYTYNSENQIIKAVERDLLDGSVKNYSFTYY